MPVSHNVGNFREQEMHAPREMTLPTGYEHPRHPCPSVTDVSFFFFEKLLIFIPVRIGRLLYSMPANYPTPFAFFTPCSCRDLNPLSLRQIPISVVPGRVSGLPEGSIFVCLSLALSVLTTKPTLCETRSSWL